MEGGNGNGNGGGGSGSGANNTGSSGPVVPFERAQRERLAAARSTAQQPPGASQAMEQSFQTPTLRQGERCRC